MELEKAKSGFAISINQHNFYLLLGGAIILILAYTVFKIRRNKQK